MTSIVRCGICGATKGLQTEVDSPRITCPKGHVTDGHKAIKQTRKQAATQAKDEKDLRAWNDTIKRARRLWPNDSKPIVSDVGSYDDL